MKNIFKKNHIIITALAIMIVIAGYLSFTNNDKPDENAVTTANPDLDDYDEFTELEGMELATDTTTDDTGTDATATDDTTDGTDTDATDDAAADDTGVAGEEENDETTPVETLEDADELGDISDEDLLAETGAQDVADNGELNLEEGVPGEAVLANAVLEADYFISHQLEREQVRAKSKQTFKDIISSSDISEESKQTAIQGLIELNDIAEKESAAESLLEARGFDNAFVFIVDGEVDVVVDAPSLSDQQLAIVEDVVKEKTDIAVEHINIIPAVVGE